MNLISLREKLDELKNTYESSQVEIQIESIKAWIEYAKGNDNDAIRLMKQATDLESKTSKAAVTPGEIIPADELLGDLYMKLNKPELALKTYEKNLKSRPYRFNGIYGAAKAAIELDNIELARYYFKQLIKLSSDIKSLRPEIIEAKDFLSKNSVTIAGNV